MDENIFKQVYDVLERYNLGCIEDIIIKYLELFEYDSEILDKAMYSLIMVLGDNYIDIINNDLTILDKLLELVQNINFR